MEKRERILDLEDRWVVMREGIINPEDRWVVMRETISNGRRFMGMNEFLHSRIVANVAETSRSN